MNFWKNCFENINAKYVTSQLDHVTEFNTNKKWKKKKINKEKRMLERRQSRNTN